MGNTDLEHTQNNQAISRHFSFDDEIPSGMRTPPATPAWQAYSKNKNSERWSPNSVVKYNNEFDSFRVSMKETYEPLKGITDNVSGFPQTPTNQTPTDSPVTHRKSMLLQTPPTSTPPSTPSSKSGRKKSVSFSLISEAEQHTNELSKNNTIENVTNILSAAASIAYDVSAIACSVPANVHASAAALVDERSPIDIPGASYLRWFLKR